MVYRHSRGVAGLARAAAGRLRSADATLVYRAGLVHDLGRVAVPAGVWAALAMFAMRHGLAAGTG